MKNIIWRSLILVLLSFFLMGSTTCQKTDGVVITDGPIATQLGKTKDEQIKGLVEQVRAEQAARELEKQQASLAAANFDGILFAAEHVETGLPRNAIEEEAKLGKARSPAPDPQEVIKAKDRVIAILQNEVAKAKELYGKAFNEAAQAKAVIAQKDKEIADRAEFIIELNDKISKLTTDAAKEKQDHKNDVNNLINKKDKELADYKTEQASKERKTWILWTRFIGLGFIVLGAGIAIIFKIVPEGASFVGVGVAIGLISIFIDWLTSQPWFYYACGGTLLLVFAVGAFALYRAWAKHALSEKKTQAIQDMIDEGKIKGDTSAADELKEHLAYRIGTKDSYWGKKLMNEASGLGLINKNGEKALKAAETIVPPVSPRE